MFLINLFILIFSFLGFSLFIKDKFKIPTSFIPFIFIASLSTYVYFLACFFLMKEGIYIFHLGFMLVFFVLYYKKQKYNLILERLLGIFYYSYFYSFLSS